MAITLNAMIEHTAIAVSAIGGALAARGKSIDLLGVVALGLVTALGGGTVRDVVAGDLPVGWIKHPEYLVNGATTSLVAFFLLRRGEAPLAVHTGLNLLDAASLALYTWAGAQKGMALGFAGPAVVVMGTFTGVAGGILRDMMLGQVPTIFRPTPALYATAAILGASVGWGLRQLAVPEAVAMASAVGTALLVRLGSFWWKVGLPAFDTKPHS
jgi:uncharacterized membrane protein YeiH